MRGALETSIQVAPIKTSHQSFPPTTAWRRIVFGIIPLPGRGGSHLREIANRIKLHLLGRVAEREHERLGAIG